MRSETEGWKKSQEGTEESGECRYHPGNVSNFCVSTITVCSLYSIAFASSRSSTKAQKDISAVNAVSWTLTISLTCPDVGTPVIYSSDNQKQNRKRKKKWTAG